MTPFLRILRDLDQTHISRRIQHVVNTQMNIKYAIRLLSWFRLTRAIVVEQDNLVGVVTLRDMVVRLLDADDRAGSRS